MHELGGWIGALIMLAVLLAAVRWGGPQERQVAAILTVAWGALLLAQLVSGRAAPAPIIALEDLAVFAMLFVLLRRSRAAWSMSVLGFQATALGVHALRWLTHRMGDVTYLTALAASSYAVLASLSAGVWLSWRARRRTDGQS